MPARHDTAIAPGNRPAEGIVGERGMETDLLGDP
jgi:hypothetical protein